MANTTPYYYLNLHLFSSIRVFIFILFCINVILFVFNVWHIAAICIPAFIFIIYLSGHFGKIHILSTDKQKNIKINGVFQTVFLEGPIQYERWWNYAINEGINVYGSLTSGKAKATSNDIYVILKCTDRNDKQVYFQERIELDSRFPNEVEYLDIPNPKKNEVIKVQRTDKIFELLRFQLTEEEFSGKSIANFE